MGTRGRGEPRSRPAPGSPQREVGASGGAPRGPPARGERGTPPPIADDGGIPSPWRPGGNSAAIVCARGRSPRCPRAAPPRGPGPAGGSARGAGGEWGCGVFYNGANVKQVDVPTLTGSFGILASHVPTLQVLKPGVVTVYGEDGTATKYFVSSGSVTVNADSTVQVLAEEAVTMDMLDLATAKSNLEKAVSEVAAASDEAAKAEAQIKVEANEALVKALE
uniref:ATP synthase F(1) complex subunit delta, mitochondrial n=1 Tax=Pavo cristatus TaxID=9049 RepID=A0A8C9G3T7_PAVCR